MWAAAVAAGFVLLAFPTVACGNRSFGTGWKAVGVNGFSPPPAHVDVPRDNIRIDPAASAWQFDPWAEVTNRAWRAGEIPLWNPYQAMGTPHAANLQSAVFDPLLAAVNLHATPLLWDLSFLLALVLGGAATYLFLREIRLDRLPSIVGTGTFILSGYFFVYSNNHFFRSYLYLPALFLLARRTVMSRHWFPPVALGIGVAGNLLIGMPEASMFVLGAVALYSIFLVLFPPGEMPRRTALIRLCAAAAFGGCLAAPLLLPAAEFTKLAYSTHEKGSRIGEIFAKPREMLGWLAPFALGDPTKGLDGLQFSGTRDWVGMGAAVAIFAGFAAPTTMRRHEGWFFAALGGTILAKCYGLPLLNRIGALPVIERSNFVAFAMPVAGFCAAVLVGTATQAVVTDQVRRRLFLVLSVIPFGGLLLLIVLNRSILADASTGHLIRHVGLAIVSGSAVFLLVLWRRQLGLVLAGVVIAELVILAPRGFQQSRADAFVTPSWLRYVLEHTGVDHERVYATDAKLFPNTASAFGLEDIRSVDALYLDRYVTYVKTFVQPTFYNKFVGGPVISQEVDKGEVADNPMFDLMGVRFLITGGSPPGSSEQYPERTSSDGAHVYENTRRIPRALLLNEVTPVRDEKEALRLFESGSRKQPSGAWRVTNIDPRQHGIVEGLPRQDADRINQCREPGQASIRRYKSRKIVISVNSPCPGLVLLTDMHYPGWVATVNGDRTPIRATDIAFRGVVVPEGRSTVAFYYQPRSFRLGLLLGLVGLATVPTTILVRRLLRKRRIVLLAVLGVCVAYWLVALTHDKSLAPTNRPSGFHAMIADGFVHGRLEVKPTPGGLVDLPDPYDSLANSRFRARGYHDLALYQGHIYTATGPTTAVLVYLPARLLGINLSPSFGTLLCAIGGFIASVGVFLECRRRYFSGLAPRDNVLAVLALGLGSPVLWLLAVGRSYENAIACGYLLVATGAFLLLRALRDPTRPVHWQLATAGAALAAAVGARPHLVVAGLFVVIAAMVIVRGTSRFAQHIPALLSLIGPYLVVGAAVALYNKARFDSFTEFGTRYQLAGMTISMPAYPLYRLQYLPPNLFDYLVRLPQFGTRWPFFHLAPSTFTGTPTRHEREPIAGLLTVCPFIVVGLTAVVAKGRSALRRVPGLVVVMTLGMVLAVLGLIAVSLPFNGSTMRYTADFAPSLAMTAVLGVAWASQQCERTGRLLRVLWIGSITLSGLFGLAFVLSPCQGPWNC